MPRNGPCQRTLRCDPKCDIVSPVAYLPDRLSGLALACHRHPRRTLAGAALSFLASLLLTAAGLDLRLDWTYLFWEDDPVVLEFQAARAKFPYPGDIVVLVDGEEASVRLEFLERLAQRLKAEPETFHHLFYKVELTGLSSKALYFLEEDQLSALGQALQAVRTQSVNLELGETGKKILLELCQQLQRSLESRGRAPHRPLWEGLPALDRERVLPYLNPVLRGDEEIHFTLDEGRIHLLMVKGGTRNSPLDRSGQAVQRLRELLLELNPSAAGLRVRLSGLPVLLQDERETCARDGRRSALVSLALVAIIFGLGFGEARRPLMALAALVCGLGWTLAYTTIVVGHLNFITVAMVTMLLGLGIDFGIHLLFRYQEELLPTEGSEKALERAIRKTGVDILVGAVATAVAFLTLGFTGFRGIADLGVIAFGGVLLCFLSTITVLPAQLALWGSLPATPGVSPLAELEQSWLGRSRAVCLLTGLGLVLAMLTAPRVQFDANLLNVQAQTLESVRTERELVSRLNRTVLSASTIVNSAERARELSRQLEELPSVQQVTSVGALFPTVTPGKQKRIEEIVALAEEITLPPPLPLQTAADLLALRTQARELESRLAQGPSDPELEQALRDLKDQLEKMEPGPIQDSLVEFQQGLLSDAARLLELLKAQKPAPPDPQDLPEGLRTRFLSPEGLFLLTVSPAKNVWEPQHLKSYLRDVQGVAPSLVGHPVIQDHILESFRRAYRVTPWFTLGGVLLVMGLYLRRFKSVLLALLPTALGVVAMFGAMGAWNIDFNLVNFVALPISVGLGAVYGVHALHRMNELGDEAILSSSTGPALLLSGVTTLVGFLSLTGSHHHGMASLGAVIAIGVAVNLLVSVVVLPCLKRAMKVK